ncbi:MAG: ATP-dependent Clp protease adaptor ClpS [Bacteroidales bacterium]|nr:ATP-dependent Clp protease adaptor ClpS [Bacteroidales bacterium]
MRSEPENVPSENVQEKYKLMNEYYLVLFNDEINKYEFVVDCLIDICRHDPIQAEQCTLIAHHKGKCDIKNGSWPLLEEMKRAFDQKGLSTIICKN